MFDYQDICTIENTSFCVECYERIDKGTVYCYYICRHCFALGTEDPDCGKCGREACVYLQQAETPYLALVEAHGQFGEPQE